MLLLLKQRSPRYQRPTRVTFPEALPGRLQSDDLIPSHRASSTTRETHTVDYTLPRHAAFPVTKTAYQSLYPPARMGLCLVPQVPILRDYAARAETYVRPQHVPHGSLAVPIH